MPIELAAIIPPNTAVHRPVIAACFVFLREISRSAFWDFCNTICRKLSFEPAMRLANRLSAAVAEGFGEHGERPSMPARLG
jgi:hypothetical protein